MVIHFIMGIHTSWEYRCLCGGLMTMPQYQFHPAESSMGRRAHTQPTAYSHLNTMDLKLKNVGKYKLVYKPR